MPSIIIELFFTTMKDKTIAVFADEGLVPTIVLNNLYLPLSFKGIQQFETTLSLFISPVFQYNMGGAS